MDRTVQTAQGQAAIGMCRCAKDYTIPAAVITATAPAKGVQHLIHDLVTMQKIKHAFLEVARQQLRRTQTTKSVQRQYRPSLQQASHAFPLTRGMRTACSGTLKSITSFRSCFETVYRTFLYKGIITTYRSKSRIRYARLSITIDTSFSLPYVQRTTPHLGIFITSYPQDIPPRPASSYPL